MRMRKNLLARENAWARRGKGPGRLLGATGPRGLRPGVKARGEDQGRPWRNPGVRLLTHQEDAEGRSGQLPSRPDSIEEWPVHALTHPFLMEGCHRVGQVLDGPRRGGGGRRRVPHVLSLVLEDL